MNRFSFDGHDLATSIRILLDAGFELSTVPGSLMEAGVVLAAYHRTFGEPHLVGFNELGLLARGGMRYLRRASLRPRSFKTMDKRERVLGFLARLCVEVAQAREGFRQDTLHKNAYTAGGLVGAGLLERETAREKLIEAALACGLDKNEARATVDRSLKRGEARPLHLEGAESVIESFAARRRAKRRKE